MRGFLPLLLLVAAAPPSRAGAEAPMEGKAVAVAPIYSRACVQRAVGLKMKLDPAKLPLPELIVASRMDAAAWRRYRKALTGDPESTIDKVLNMFDPAERVIYMNDDPALYGGGRSYDGVYAHETAHYFQSKHPDSRYGGDGTDDFAEDEAVRMQQWFDGTFTLGGADPCAFNP